MEVRYLTVEQVQSLHDEQIERYTPDEPNHVLDWGALDSTCKRPCQTHYYNQDSDICDLAASLGFGLAKNHVFANANKRTAAVCTHVFLLLNGYTLTLEQEELVDLYVCIAKDEITEEGLADILAEHTRELTDDEREFLELGAGED